MKFEDYQEWLCDQTEYCRKEEERWKDRDNPAARMFYEGKREAFEMALYKTNEVNETPNRLKMFVWEKVLTDYTDGLMVALAHDVEEARALLRIELGGINGGYVEQDPDVYEIPKAVLVYGGG